MFAYWWAVFVYGIVFGIVTNIVIKNKGYKENWFWWGFFFGVFALIVACTKPSKVAVTGIVQTPVVSSPIPQAVGLENDYVTLCNIPEKQYSNGSPILICEGELLKEKATEKVFVRCRFQVITKKKIKAAFVSVFEYDVAGDYLSKTDCQYLDLDRMDGICFGEKKLVALANIITRKIEIVCTKVIYEDDTKWESSEAWKALPQQPTISSVLGSDIAEQYRQEVKANAKYVPDNTEHYWNCACGCMNYSSNAYCVKCGADKFKVFSAYDKEALLKKVNEKKQREEAAAQKAAQEAQAIAQAALERKRKNKKMLMIYGPIVVGIFVVILLLVNVVIPGVKYSQADKLVEAGQYAEAIKAYKAIDDSEKTKERIGAAYYTYGEELLAEEQFDKAVTQFQNAGDYKDAKDRAVAAQEAKQERINANEYNKAEAMLAIGAKVQAYTIFKELEGYQDSVERAEQLKNEIQQDVQIQFICFNTDPEDDTTILERIPNKSNYLRYRFEVIKNSSFVEIHIKTRAYWPGYDKPVYDAANWPIIEQGHTYWGAWEDGYSWDKDGNFKIEIIIEDTDIVLATLTAKFG